MIGRLGCVCGGLGNLAQNKQQHARIDVASAGSADNAAGRRETHGCIETLAVADRGYGRTIAEMSHDQLLRHVRLQLVDDRLVGNAVIAIAAYPHRGIFRGDRHVLHDFRHGAMEVVVENREVGNAGEKAQRLPHDVYGDGRVQRRKRGVALHFINQFGCDELIFFDGRPAGYDTMADGSRRREVARVKRIGDQSKSHSPRGQ